MLKRFVRIIGGDPNKKKIQEIATVAEEINALEPKLETLSPEELAAKTNVERYCRRR